jgi:DNA helicase-2/ATP-dependent DNA helicase PcrA
MIRYGMADLIHKKAANQTISMDRVKVADQILPFYISSMHGANALDFDDLILVFLKLIRENFGVRYELQLRFRHLLVDECQDTNLVQYEIIKLLSHPNFLLQPTSSDSWTSQRELSQQAAVTGKEDLPHQKRSLFAVGDIGIFCVSLE